MTLLSARGLAKSFGGRALLDNAEIYVEPGEKIGLVGKNGTGKSTLLACLAGDDAFDSGIVAFRNGTHVAVLRQAPPDSTSGTVLDLVLAGAAQRGCSGFDRWH